MWNPARTPDVNVLPPVDKQRFNLAVAAPCTQVFRYRRLREYAGPDVTLVNIGRRMRHHWPQDRASTVTCAGHSEARSDAVTNWYTPLTLRGCGRLVAPAAGCAAEIGAGRSGWLGGARFAKDRVVPLAGLEPARCRHQQILSLPRLPIPPQGQGGGSYLPLAGGQRPHYMGEATATV